MAGPAATFARVGDPVVHVFRCDNGLLAFNRAFNMQMSSDLGSYAMLVRDCTVSDGKENYKKLIDHNG